MCDYNGAKNIGDLVTIPEFFVEQYDTVRSIVDNLFLRGLSDDQLRHQPEEGLNSIAWHIWHTARWQDYANTLIDNNRSPIVNEEWLNRINVSRRSRHWDDAR